MSDVDTPFVKFSKYHIYCKKCKHEKVPETEDPCDECLREPVQQFTFRPINYKPKED